MPSVSKPSPAEVEQIIVRLRLQREGALRSTPSSVVCEVVLDGRPAFLKVTHEPEEIAGARALRRWGGCGAVTVLAEDGPAVVLERAGGTLRSLVTDDAAATQVLCSVAERLHRHSPANLDGFPTLREWFSSLFADTSRRFDQVRELADQLLDHAAPGVLLHGDLHHENVLDGAGRGWLAVDPKGIIGAREFDYCTIFTNWTPRQAHRQFDARLHTVARAAGIDTVHLLRWITAWSALSGIWHLEDGDDRRASFPHSVTDLALDRLQTHLG